MTEGLPDNVKLQISLENDKNDKVNETKLLSKTDLKASLNLFRWMTHRSL